MHSKQVLRNMSAKETVILVSMGTVRASMSFAWVIHAKA